MRASSGSRLTTNGESTEMKLIVDMVRRESGGQNRCGVRALQDQFMCACGGDFDRDGRKIRRFTAAHDAAHSMVPASNATMSRIANFIRPIISLNWEHQFAEGFSARSITTISTGPFADSNFSPSCS